MLFEFFEIYEHIFRRKLIFFWFPALCDIPFLWLQRADRSKSEVAFPLTTDIRIWQTFRILFIDKQLKHLRSYFSLVSSLEQDLRNFWRSNQKAGWECQISICFNCKLNWIRRKNKKWQVWNKDRRKCIQKGLSWANKRNGRKRKNKSLLWFETHWCIRCRAFGSDWRSFLQVTLHLKETYLISILRTNKQSGLNHT